MITRHDTSPMCKRSVAERIARYYKTDLETVISPSRKQHLVTVRLAIVHVLYNYFTYTTLQQKAYIINRDHSTVVWAINRTSNKYDYLAQQVVSEMDKLFKIN